MIEKQTLVYDSWGKVIQRYYQNADHHMIENKLGTYHNDWCKSEDVAKLEAENEQYHKIVSDMSSQLRKAAEEKAELEKDIKALRESYDFLQFKYDNFLNNIKQILEDK